MTAVLTALVTGFLLGFTLLFAIGAQNAFVLRQGLLRRHVFAVALFCAVADAALIILGVAGFALFITDLVGDVEQYLFGAAALWLGAYGVVRLRGVFAKNSLTGTETDPATGLRATLLILAVLTFGNPHVYLDTVVLVGAVSVSFDGFAKFSYAAGAVIASFVFFFGLAYGGGLLAPHMARPGAWRLFDGIVALIMFALAAAMARQGGWL